MMPLYSARNGVSSVSQFFLLFLCTLQGSSILIIILLLFFHCSGTSNGVVQRCAVPFGQNPGLNPALGGAVHHTHPNSIRKSLHEQGPGKTRSRGPLPPAYLR